jgi:hypothetical protein
MGSPDFADNLVWELGRIDQSEHFYVRILHNGKPLKVCGEPGQETELCKWDDWGKLNDRWLVGSGYKNNEICGKEWFNKALVNDAFWVMTGLVWICLMILYYVVKCYRNLVNMTVEVFGKRDGMGIEDLESTTSELEEKYLDRE